MGKARRRVLVTGGAGFIGSHLVPRLLEKGYSVVVLDNLCSGRLGNLREVRGHPNFGFERGDVRNRIAVRNAVREVDAVVHLAALIDVGASVVDPFETHEVNVTGTLNVLQEAVKHEVRRFVFASSTAVYGDAGALPVKEDDALKPISPYAASKVSGESYCSAFAGCYGLDAVVLRLFNVYGLRSAASPYSGVITKFLRKISNGGVLTVTGDGEQTRDFIHVSDVVDAVILALEGEGLRGEVFNVCTGVPTSINQLVDALRRITGKDLRVRHSPPRRGDIRNNYGDPMKAQLSLLFKSKMSLHQGLSALAKRS